MKNSTDLILGEVAYIAIIYHFLDSLINLSNGYDFSFDHTTGENRECIDIWLILTLNLELTTKY